LKSTHPSFSEFLIPNPLLIWRSLNKESCSLAQNLHSNILFQIVRAREGHISIKLSLNGFRIFEIKFKFPWDPPVTLSLSFFSSHWGSPWAGLMCQPLCQPLPSSCTTCTHARRPRATDTPCTIGPPPAALSSTPHTACRIKSSVITVKIFPLCSISLTESSCATP
jgi:hypothetical protein